MAPGHELAPDRSWLLGIVGTAAVALLALVLWLGFSAKPPVTSSRKAPPPETLPTSAAPEVVAPTVSASAPPRAQVASSPTAQPSVSTASRPAQVKPAAPPAVNVPAPSTPREARKPAPAAPDRLCGELVQRMQLGEPLSPEQSATFQRECTRR